MEITIAFSKSNHPPLGINFIGTFMKTEYSHVLVYWEAKGINRTLVYQASKGKVHFIEMQNFLKDNTIVKEYKLNITDLQYKTMVQKCVDLAGQPYSYITLVKIALREVFLKMGINLKLKDSKGYVCSELLASILEDIFDKPFLINNYFIKPSDIDLFLKKHTS